MATSQSIYRDLQDSVTQITMSKETKKSMEDNGKVNKYSIATAGSVLPEVLDQLPPLPDEVSNTAQVLADVVGMSQWAVGKNPKSVASTCVYVADLVHDRDGALTQREIAEYGPSSGVTIRKHYREIPSVFLDKTDDDDLHRFNADIELPDEHESIIERLEAFREAEDRGLGMHRYVGRGGGAGRHG